MKWLRVSANSNVRYVQFGIVVGSLHVYVNSGHQIVHSMDILSSF